MTDPSPRQPVIAIDAMGGDHGADTIVAGVAEAAARFTHFRFQLHGRQDAIHAALARHAGLAAQVSVHHVDGIVEAEERVAAALRKARTSSMGCAIEAVKTGGADAALSAGNTGALMAIAKLSLRTMPGIDRPALAALIPTLAEHDCVMLDLGANTECDARNLVQFAAMGAAYSRILYGFDAPRTRILNIGTEEQKGTDEIRDAAALLRAASHLPLDFQGFTEADKLSRGDVDVVVTDGFSGNIALKAVEGAARFVGDLLKRSFMSSLRSKLGFLISRPATELLRHHLDPNNHNGAVFLGLNGVVVKSHGGANAAGIANAIAKAARLVEARIADRIAESLAQIETPMRVEAVAERA